MDADSELRVALAALANCVDLIEAWAYGPMMSGIEWPEGECKAPALLEAKRLLRVLGK